MQDSFYLLWRTPSHLVLRGPTTSWCSRPWKCPSLECGLDEWLASNEQYMTEVVRCHSLLKLSHNKTDSHLGALLCSDLDCLSWVKLLLHNEKAPRRGPHGAGTGLPTRHTSWPRSGPLPQLSFQLRQLHQQLDSSFMRSWAWEPSKPGPDSWPTELGDNACCFKPLSFMVTRYWGIDYWDTCARSVGLILTEMKNIPVYMIAFWFQEVCILKRSEIFEIPVI